MRQTWGGRRRGRARRLGCTLFVAGGAACLSSASFDDLDLAQTVMVTPTPNLAADPNHSSHVLLQLRRGDGVPLAGAEVQITARGCAVEQEGHATGETGLITAEVRCGQAGPQEVLAYLNVAGEQRLLPQSLTLNVFAPSDAAGGLPVDQPLSVQAYADDGAQIDTALRGTVRVESSDPAAFLPSDFTLGEDDLGAHMWPQAVLLRTPGPQSVAVRHLPTGRLLSSMTYDVAAVAASSLALTIDTRQPTAHVPVEIGVAATDASGAPLPLFGGTVRFFSSDTAADLPEATAFLPADGGRRSFQVTFATPGPQRLRVVDTDGVLQPAELSALQVGEGPAAALTLDLPAAATQGTDIALALTPRDAAGLPTHNVDDVVHFASSDPAALLPPDLALAGPLALAAGLQLRSVGPQQVTAAGLAQPGRLSATAVVEVAPLAATHLEVEAPASAVAGQPIALTITARGALGSVALGYTGTVRLTTSDPAGVALGTASLGAVAGSLVVPDALALATAGPQTVTAADLADPTIQGTSAPVAVVGGAASQLSLSLSLPPASSPQSLVPVDMVLTAADRFGNPSPAYVGAPQVVCSDPCATLPADCSLRAVDQGQRRFAGGLIFATSGTTTLGATATGLGPATLTVQVAPGPASRFDLGCDGGAVFGNVFLGDPIHLKLQVFDLFGNLATLYTGTAKVTAGGAATTPAGAQHAFTAADGGVAGFAFQTQSQVANFYAVDVANGELFSQTTVLTSPRPQNCFGGDLQGGQGVTHSAGGCYTIALARGTDLRPVIAWSDWTSGYQIFALKWDGTSSWQQLAGSAVAGGISGGLPLVNNSPSLAIDPAAQTPAVAWLHSNPDTKAGSIYYRAYSPGSGAWVELGGSASGGGIDGQTTALPGAPALAFLAGQPLIVWSTQANSSAGGTIQALTWSGSAWTAPSGAGQVDLGLTGGSYAPQLAIDGSGVANVAWENYGSGRGQIYLRQLISGSWTGLAGSDSGGGISNSPGNASAVTLALGAGGRPWLAWLDDAQATVIPATAGSHVVRARTTDGSSWYGVGNSDALIGIGGLLRDCQAPAMTVDANNVATVVWTRNVLHGSCLQLRQLQAGQWLGVNGSDGPLGTGLGSCGRSAGPLPASLLPDTGGAVLMAVQVNIFGSLSFNVAVVSWP